MATSDFKRSRYCNFLLYTAFIFFVNNAKCDNTTSTSATEDNISMSTSLADTVTVTMDITETVSVSNSSVTSTFTNVMPTTTLDAASVANNDSLGVINMTQISPSTTDFITSSSLFLSSQLESMTMTSSLLDSSISSIETIEPSNVIGTSKETMTPLDSNTHSAMNTNTVSENTKSLTVSPSSTMKSIGVLPTTVVINSTSPVPHSTTASQSPDISNTHDISTSSQVGINSETSTIVKTSSLQSPTSSEMTTNTISSISSTGVTISPSSSEITNSTVPSSSQVILATSTISPSSSEITNSAVPSSSQVILTTSTMSISSTASSTPTTTARTTTPNPTSGLPGTIVPPIDENTVYNIETKITLFTCIRDNNKLKIFFLEVLKGIEGFKDVIIIRNTCADQSRKKRETSYVVDTKLVLGVKNINKTTVAQEIVDAFNSSGNATIEDGFVAKAEKIISDICSSTICLNHHGYNCTSSGPEYTCVSICNSEKCSDHGKCVIVLETIGSYGTKCVCDSEEFYKYEGETCETKRMKWELAVAIAGGVGGAIILILLFIICLCCCCKRNDDKYEYNRPASYEPMSDLLNRSPLYRNEGVKTHQAGFANFGFDNESYGEDISAQPLRQTNGHQSWHPEASKHQSWNPEASKETYAKIAEKIEKEKSFQIKRPQLSTSSKSQSDPGEAATGF